MIDQGMLMAAGLGTRLRPFTERAPKPLLPVLGVPMAQFALDQLTSAGVTRVVANVHHLAREAEAALRALDLGGAELAISDESLQLLGSAGGLRKALPRFGGKPFFLVNADVISDVDLRALAFTHERLRARFGVKMTMAICPCSPGHGKYRKIHVDGRGLITAAGDLGQQVPFFVGSAVIEPEAIAQLDVGPAEFVPAILQPLIAEGKAGAHWVQGRWHDLGSPALWMDAHFSLLEALETGELTPRLRRRIERRSRRVASLAWAAVESKSRPVLMSGPCYWGGTGRAPREFGPRAVFYGSGAPDLGAGIGWNGLWAKPS